MAKDRRIVAIELIQRVRQQEIDAIGSQLATVRGKQSATEAELHSLRERALLESNMISPETLPFLAGFLGSVATRSALLQTQLQDLNQQAEALEKTLRQAFIEAKTNETVLELHRQKQRLKDERRELAGSAEVAQNIYLQQRRTP